MRKDRTGRGRVPSRRTVANDNVGPEARIEAVVMTLARLLGRRIAREHFDRLHATRGQFQDSRGPFCNRAGSMSVRRNPSASRSSGTSPPVASDAMVRATAGEVWMP